VIVVDGAVESGDGLGGESGAKSEESGRLFVLWLEKFMLFLTPGKLSPAWIVALGKRGVCPSKRLLLLLPLD
jgi:hypothetical protein